MADIKFAGEEGAADADFVERVICFLNDGAVDVGVLNQELAADPRKREKFVRLCMIDSIAHEELSQRDHAAVPGVFDLFQDLDSLRGGANDGVDLSNSIVTPSINPVEVQTDQQDEIFQPGPVTPATLKTSGRPKWLRWGRRAAIFLVVAGSVSFWWLHHQQAHHQQAHVATEKPERMQIAASVDTAPVAAPIATLTATAGVEESDPQATLGSKLTAGTLIKIQAGAVELGFGSGAVAIVQGPARFRIINSNAIALEDGALTAHVPGPARGFRVDSPGLSVVDRGTDFGVRANAGKANSEITVFTGIVDVSAVDSKGHPTAAVLHAVAGQAFSHQVTEAEPQTAVYAPQAFVRDISETRIALPFHSSGDGLAIGAADPNWLLVSVPGDTAFKPRPAYVPALTGITPYYTPNSDDCKWIGVNKKLDDQPSGNFWFRTNVDLGDYDLASLQVLASVAVDDAVTDIRVNGVGIDHSELPDIARNVMGASVTLSSLPWHKGVNQVDIEVLNKPLVNRRADNWMILQVRWSATVSPNVHRFGRKAF